MQLQLLEVLGILLLLYLITQHFIPSIWPNQFEKNWLFKKNKPLDEKIEKLANRKSKLNNDILETKDELRANAEKVDRADKELDKL